MKTDSGLTRLECGGATNREYGGVGAGGTEGRRWYSVFCKRQVSSHNVTRGLLLNQCIRRYTHVPVFERKFALTRQSYVCSGSSEGKLKLR